MHLLNFARSVALRVLRCVTASVLRRTHGTGTTGQGQCCYMYYTCICNFVIQLPVALQCCITNVKQRLYQQYDIDIRYSIAVRGAPLWGAPLFYSGLLCLSKLFSKFFHIVLLLFLFVCQVFSYCSGKTFFISFIMTSSMLVP